METRDRLIKRKLELSHNAIASDKQMYVSSFRRSTVLRFINKVVIGAEAALRG